MRLHPIPVELDLMCPAGPVRRPTGERGKLGRNPLRRRRFDSANDVRWVNCDRFWTAGRHQLLPQEAPHVRDSRAYFLHGRLQFVHSHAKLVGPTPDVIVIEADQIAVHVSVLPLSAMTTPVCSLRREPEAVDSSSSVHTRR
jgi:hypothetical protein